MLGGRTLAPYSQPCPSAKILHTKVLAERCIRAKAILSQYLLPLIAAPATTDARPKKKDSIEGSNELPLILLSTFHVTPAYVPRSWDTLGCGREVFETYVMWTLSWKEQSLKARMPNITNTKRLAHQHGSYPPGSARTKPEMLELVELVVCAQREDIHAKQVLYS